MLGTMRSFFLAEERRTAADAGSTRLGGSSCNFFVVLIREFVCSNEFDSGNDYVIKFGRAVKKYRRLVKDIYPSADYNDTLYIVCI